MKDKNYKMQNLQIVVLHLIHINELSHQNKITYVIYIK